MKLGLGIDTGGTYTDAVIYDFDTREAAAWAKAPTTRENLTVGICGALDRLPRELLGRVERAALSTTLATNACVEGRGGRARLILIGCQRRIVESVGREYGLPPAEEILFVEGGHDRQGNLTREPDWESLRSAILEQDALWDAYALVEIWGARNPEVELRARERIAAWTGKPAVTGHEITGELNSLKRAASALLNAQLLPVIGGFLQAVQEAFRERGLDCPTAIVRGDGTLMTRGFAACRPIETLLCGPASSVLGGSVLSGMTQGIVVDMGGTTSDIAMIRDGLPVMSGGGAAVGGWRTGIASMDIETLGLGGDSLVRLEEKAADGLAIGPGRVIPLASLAARYPAVQRELERILRAKRRHSLSLGEFFLRQREPGALSGVQQRLWDALAEGPLSVQQLAERAGVHLYHLDREMAPLEQGGYVMRSALTPTDALHGLGQMSLWPAEASRMGLDILGLQSGESGLRLAARIREGVSRRLHRAVCAMLLRQRWPKAMDKGIQSQMEQWIAQSFDQRALPGEYGGEGDFLLPAVRCRVPLIGVGAPIAHFLPEAARALGCQPWTGDMSPVANALGAITASVVAQVKLTVKPDQEIGGPGGFHVYGAPEKPWFADYDEALAWACQQAEVLAAEAARAQGAAGTRAGHTVRERVGYITPAEDDPQRLAMFNGGVVPEAAAPADDGILLETVITARAQGEMDWTRLAENAI